MVVNKISYDNALNDVLQKPKYDILTGRKKHLLDIIKDFLNEVSHRIILFLQNHFNPNITNLNTKGIYNFFIIVFVIIAIIVAIIIARHIIKNKKKSIKTMNEIFADLSENNITTKELLAQSLVFENENNFRQAYRLRYIILLWVLNIKKVIILSESKTNSELKREVKANLPNKFENFSSAINTFNDSWFGKKTIDLTLYNNALQQIDLILEDKNNEKNE